MSQGALQALQALIQRCDVTAPKVADASGVEKVSLQAVLDTIRCLKPKELALSGVGAAAASLAMRATALAHAPYPLSAALDTLRFVITNDAISEEDTKRIFTAHALHDLVALFCVGEPQYGGRDNALVQSVAGLLAVLYVRVPPLREPLRQHIFHHIQRYAQTQMRSETGQHFHVSNVLDFANRIVAGYNSARRLSDAQGYFRSGVLYPLYENTTMMDADTTAALSLYTPSLTKLTITTVDNVARHNKGDGAQAIEECFANIVGAAEAVITKKQGQTKVLMCFLSSLRSFLECEGEWRKIAASKGFIDRVTDLMLFSLMSPHEALQLTSLYFLLSAKCRHFIVRGGGSGAVSDEQVKKLVRCIVSNASKEVAAWSLPVCEKQMDLLVALEEEAPNACKTACDDVANDGGDRPTFQTHMLLLRSKLGKRENDIRQVKALKAEREGQERKILDPKEACSHLQFVFDKKIGEGAFSTVRTAMKIERNVPASVWVRYAIKTIARALVDEQDCSDAVRREIAALKALQNTPGIVQLCGYFEDEKNIYEVMELCSKGDVYDLACNPKNNLPSHRWSAWCLMEVVVALNAVHAKGYLFADLKPENLLIANDGHVRICDFGSVLEAPANMSTGTTWDVDRFSGTPEYLAPELVPAAGDTTTAGVRHLCGFASDMWALGCLAFQLLFGFLPFRGAQIEQVFDAIRCGTVDFSVSAKTGAEIPASGIDMIKSLLSPDPKNRPSCEQLMSHPFFAEFGIRGTVFAEAPETTVCSDVPRVLPTENGFTAAAELFGRKQSMMWLPKGLSSAVDAKSQGVQPDQSLPEEDATVEPWATALP